MTTERQDAMNLFPMLRHEMTEIDSRATDALADEISQLSQKGVDITIGDANDRAYDTPENIYRIYETLHEMDEALANVRSETLGCGLADAALKSSVLESSMAGSLLEEKREAFRNETLFIPYNAVRWHKQRGQAAALLAIASAHDLMIDGDSSTGIYPTMSGPLQERVVDYRFDSRAGWLNGRTTKDALMHIDVTLLGNPYDVAHSSSNERLEELREYTNTPSSSLFREVVQYCTDGLGIRSRKAEVNQAIFDHVSRQDIPNDERLMMSFGCGTALPMLEAIDELKKQKGISTKLILLDQDPLSLAAAACLAEDMGLSENIEIHCQQLFVSRKPLKLDTILQGRRLDVAEDSGLREYLPDVLYKELARESWSMLKPGGLMTTGNMNKNRPQAEFLHGMMGWAPAVKMRTIESCLDLHQKAGIPAEHTRVKVTGDGVYSMYFTTKPS